MADEPTAEVVEETPAQDADVEVAEAELPEAAPTDQVGPGGPIDVLLDVRLPVEVRLGEVQAPIRELLRLGPGSVLKLDQHVGEPVDLYIGEARFATAQIVVVGEELGVRIQEVLSSPSDGAEAEG